MHEKLRGALAAANSARDEYHANCMIVWRELVVTESDLAEEILALGFDEAAAAEWLCRLNSDGDTHAAGVAQGRSAEVRVAILRAAHGVVG